MDGLALATQLVQCRDLREVLAAVRELRERRVDGLQVEQGELVERVSFQRGLL
nr:hypothetical protein [Mumia quercus]